MFARQSEPAGAPAAIKVIESVSTAVVCDTEGVSVAPAT